MTSKNCIVLYFQVDNVVFKALLQLRESNYVATVARRIYSFFILTIVVHKCSVVQTHPITVYLSLHAHTKLSSSVILVHIRECVNRLYSCYTERKKKLYCLSRKKHSTNTLMHI